MSHTERNSSKAIAEKGENEVLSYSSQYFHNLQNCIPNILVGLQLADKQKEQTTIVWTAKVRGLLISEHPQMSSQSQKSGCLCPYRFLLL